MQRRRENRLAPWLLSLLACTATTLAADADAAELTAWADQELAPYVASQLTEHPRFRGETVVFVALEDGAPAPVTNALVLALRDRLVNSIADSPGINIGWQSGAGAAAHDGSSVDCTRDAVHYYIGLAATRLMDGRHRVTLRVLDAEDRSWVTGTGKTWEGHLTRAQQRAFERPVTDEYFRGSREVPFSAAQADILAARLAHELSCKLLRQVAGEYVIAAATTTNDPAPAAPFPGALELVRNNLAGNPALHITSDPGAANARLAGKAHPITGDLHQYWVTVTPTGNAAALPDVSASVYVRLPGTPAQSATPAVAAAPAGSMPTGSMPSGTSAGGLIAPLRVVEPRQRRACFDRAATPRQQRLVAADPTIARGDCFLLQTRVNRDASVVLLDFQVQHGLVSLSDPRCGPSTAWLAAGAGQALQFPAANDPRPSASAWPGHPGLESFYAIAVADRNAARELGALVAQLPARCTLSPTQGLTGQALQAWLGGLREITDRWQHALEWQAVRVEHVY